MHKKFHLCLLLAVTLLLSSCQKEDVPQTDYSIESNDYFELISQHENGWIKEARHGGDQPTREYEYYQNGYIKTAKIYSNAPQQHLYLEVSRSEDNKPLWSKYYYPDGNLWFETEYENGLPSNKKVYSETGTTIYTYTNGDLSSAEFTASDNSTSSKTIYDKSNGQRAVTINNNGENILTENHPYQEKFGASINTNAYMPLGNPFGISETSYFHINETFSRSPTWQNKVNPLVYFYPYRLFDGYFYNDYQPQSGISFAITDELYQSIIEQYPFTEDEVLVGGYKYQHGSDNFNSIGKVRDSLKAEYNNNPELFELKYGNQYVTRVGYGKNYIIIGAIRNLPTNDNVATDIKELARKKMQNIMYSPVIITAEEQEILNKVWFELKFFSTLKEHRNGVVLNSHEDYLNVLQEVYDAEVSIIQLFYSSFEDL